MNSTENTPENDTNTISDARDGAGHDGDHRDHDHGRSPRGPRGAGHGRRGFGAGAGPTIVIQNGVPQGFGPRAGFGGGHGFEPGHGHAFGAGHGHHGPAFGPFAGARPKKGDIRLMKRVRSIAIELGKYRGTASKEQRAAAVAKLDETIVEIKRILAS
jgi:hypothetical protein